MVFCQFYKKDIERSDTLTLVSLDHFRHLFVPLYQSDIIGDGNKDKYSKVESANLKID